MEDQKHEATVLARARRKNYYLTGQPRFHYRAFASLSDACGDRIFPG